MHEITELVEQLRQATEAYSEGAPLMSDAEFDALEDQLRDMDPDNAYFAEVGAVPKPKSGWRKVKHAAPMGSLLKVQTTGELATWYQTMPDDDLTEGFIMSEKLDGISISLKYKAGKLVQAATRGDGETGENITRNVLRMQGVRTEVGDKFTGHIRGEIVLLKSIHHKHLPEYKNPRNAAAGIAKRESDPSLCRHLTVMVYQAISDDEDFGAKEYEFEWLVEQKFIVPNWAHVGFQQVADLYNLYVEYTRKGLDYDIDGLVVEVNNLEAMENLGEHDGRPKGARAFKFPHEEQRTTLREIHWQVGNSGRVTPVAYFEPVQLAGATVSQASLHNTNNMDRLWGTRPCAGDTILVSRRNDVIPYVEAVVARAKKNRIDTPSQCPSCGGALDRDGAYLMCLNSAECPAQQSGAIKRWVKKLDIKEWGDALIDTLCETSTVLCLADLYKLKEADLAVLEVGGKRLGASTAKKVLRNLHAKKTLALADLVGAMGIDLWGQSMCQILVDAGFDTWEKMEAADHLELSSVVGVGSTKARAFLVGFHEVSPTIAALLAAGIEVKEPVTGGCLNGKSFCFTGIRNKDLETRIKEAGGQIKGSVGKGLTYLVAKDPQSTSGKAKKAKEHGVEVVGVADVEAML